MAERSTYFAYRESFDPLILRIGNIVLDYGNPKTRVPYIHAQLSTEDLKQWVSADHRPFAYMLHQNGRSCKIGGGVLNLAELQLMGSSAVYTMVCGKSASRVELNEPEKFFEQVILNSTDAIYWLSSRLAIARKLKILRNLTFQHPKIWFLTGLYLIEDGTSLSLTNTSNGVRVGASVPIPDPTMITALQQITVGGKFEIGSGMFQGAATQISGNRVWAAQYQRISAEYVTLKGGMELPTNCIKLLSIFSVQRGVPNAADAMVTGDFAADENDTEQADAEDFDDEYWQEFEKEARSIDADFAAED